MTYLMSNVLSEVCDLHYVRIYARITLGWGIKTVETAVQRLCFLDFGSGSFLILTHFCQNFKIIKCPFNSEMVHYN